MGRKIVCLFLALLVLTGCQSAAVDLSQFTWLVSLEETTVMATLETKSEVTQYDGTITEEVYLDQAAADHVYVLAHLSIVKQIAGGDAFTWSDIYLLDKEGNIYSRIEDGFLELHGYDRLGQTDIRIGEVEGWVAFEVLESSLSSLELLYTSADGELKLDVDANS